jgi:hypothetical protein
MTGCIHVSHFPIHRHYVARLFLAWLHYNFLAYLRPSLLGSSIVLTLYNSIAAASFERSPGFRPSWERQLMIYLRIVSKIASGTIATRKHRQPPPLQNVVFYLSSWSQSQTWLFRSVKCGLWSSWMQICRACIGNTGTFSVQKVRLKKLQAERLNSAVQSKRHS